MTTSPPTPEIQIWHIDRLVMESRNLRKNDAAVDRSVFSSAPPRVLRPQTARALSMSR
jgi:hypothetical protein